MRALPQRRPLALHVGPRGAPTATLNLVILIEVFPFLLDELCLEHIWRPVVVLGQMHVAGVA
eukprot:1377546-Pyramimonas_sp.AAC.1